MFLAMLLAGGQALAQSVLELRGADSKYRYADWSYTFRRSLMMDLFYVGVPGSNEFNLGGGYAFKPRPSLLIAPLVYAVIGKEGGQRGVKLAALAVFEKAGWKANVFFAHYTPATGAVHRYQVLDTGDLTHVIRTRWEAGVSTGFFHSEGKWNPQIGPLVKMNDHLGAWGLSYRFGPEREFRLTRVLLLTK
jgi:hypothetical protein